jgi:alpha/beta superfamily hydrolase
MTSFTENLKLQVPAGAEPALALEAVWTRSGSGPGAVVAPPHPLYGGTLKNPVIAATADGLLRAGVATLAFNYRGTEASEGEATDSLEAAVSDYRAAFDALRARATGPYIAAGYSFGAGTALLSCLDDPQLVGVVLVAPPVGMLRSEDLAALTGRVLVLVGDDDDYAPLPELTARLAVRADAVLDVIAGADHFFHFGGLSEISTRVAQHVRSWL